MHFIPSSGNNHLLRRLVVVRTHIFLVILFFIQPVESVETILVQSVKGSIAHENLPSPLH